jgi:hypothetical protein
MSINRMLLLARTFRRKAKRRAASPLEIGQIVKSVECAADLSDCYPRALITAFLCIRAGLNCKIAVGILAPTRKMHAWCSTGGQIPYEPRPEHWFYQPLAVFDVTN